MSGRLLSYPVYGQPEQPTLLMLHGFLGCKEDWQEIASALSKTHYIITADLPGHGESIEGYSESDYTMAGCSELLASLLNSLKIDKCTPIGYSMGGRLALYFALHHADRCTALILESASPGLRTEQERADRCAHDLTIANRLSTLSLELFLDEWYAQPLFETLRNAAGFDVLLSRRRHNSPTGLALSLKQMGTGAQPSLWAQLTDIKLPVLLMTGERDTKFTHIALNMAAALPDCSTVVIENAGHTIHFEAPDRYIAEVQRFLSERK